MSTEQEKEQEKVDWQFKKKLNFVKVLDKISLLTETVVRRDIADIVSRVDMLHSMGIIQDNDKVRELKEKLSKLNIEGKQK